MISLLDYCGQFLSRRDISRSCHLPTSSLYQRISRGIILIVMTVVIACGAVLAYPHIAGLVYYKPRLDRLFEALHRDPILLDALRQQNAAFAGKDEAWALSLDQAWNAERLLGDGPLQRAVME